MGRLKDLVSKMKDEVAPLATVVREEVAQKMEKVVDRVLSGPARPQAATAGAPRVERDEWAFTPAAKPATNGAAQAGEDVAVPLNSAALAADGSRTTGSPTESGSSLPANGAPAPGATPKRNGAADKASAAEATNGAGASSPANAPTKSASPATDAATNGAAASSPAPAVQTNGAVNGATTNGATNGAASPGPAAAEATTPAAAPAAPIKINAQPSPTDPNVCKFTVEVPVFEDRLIRIKSRELADEHSPLAAKIFEIPQITAVTFSSNVITVTKKGPEPWQMIARQIGPAIRAHLASGQPALAKELPEEPKSELDNDALFARVQNVIDTLINPGVAGHGGYVTLLGVDGDIAYVRMGGGCQGCGMADLTLKQGIVSTIRSQVPEISQVLDETDHEAGANPFFAR